MSYATIPYIRRTATQHIAASAVASAAVQVNTVGMYSQHRVTIDGAGTFALSYSETAAGVPVPVIPTAGATSDCIVMLGNSTEVFSLPSQCFIRTIGSATANIYISAGTGE